MALNLSIIKSPAGVSLSVSDKAFDEQGGSIGRGDSNDWVLSDPDRFLSSRHCSISFESGQYFLTDTSTNGTFINGSPEPLGKGGRVPISHGDTVEMGDYQFRVESQAADLGNDPFAPSLEADPFDVSPFDSSPDPFASPASSQPPPPPAQSQPDPFLSDPFSQQGDVSLNPDPLQMDPLAALDDANRPAGNNPASDPFASPQIPSEDFLSQSPVSPQTPQDDYFNQQGSHSDGAGAMNQAVDWPDAKNENLIPDDWDDLLDDAGPLEEAIPPVPKVSPAPPSRPPGRSPIPGHEIKDEHRSIPLTDPPKVAKPAKTHPPMGEPLLAERKPERVDAFQSQPREQAPAAPPKPKKPAVEKPPAAGNASSPDIGNILLKSLNLDNRQLSDEEINNIYQAIGELMPVIVTGMMQVLRSRASIKNEFRMNVTTIQPIENNPLKFSADASEAIENMFVRKSGAYMGPQQAFQEGFDGIGEHQVAIIAGIRAAFKSMMDRFNPDLLERQFEKQAKGVSLPGMQKTKYWNNYIDYYKGFVDNMENTFQYLFGDEFVQAYEEQLRRLAAERKKRQKFDN